MHTLEISGHSIGAGYPCFIIAEAGVNHNGSLETAFKLVDAAADTGADAVKFQTFRSDTLVTRDAPKATYQQTTTGTNESQYEMLRRLELTPDNFAALKTHCDRKKVVFLSTPFDPLSADLLENLDVSAFKISSGEITNLPFLTHVAQKGRPLIVSTGMATLGEVEAALQAIEAAGNPPLAVLHCVSNYPADPADVNLRAMNTIRTAFDVPVGYSDHTLGIAVPLAAVALGACIIEKHFTLDRNAPGPDHQASATPAELSAMIYGIRTIEAAFGNGRKEPAKSETNTRFIARRSLVAACDIPPGTPLTLDKIAIKRPGSGLSPALQPHLIGRVARVFIPQGALFSLDMFN